MRTYISLFSSAGVGCFGLKKLGFTCIATAELIEKRINIQRVNEKCKYENGYICGDLTSGKTKQELLQAIDDFKHKESVKDVDLIIATPPCQGMSVANHKKNDELARNSLVVESIKIIKTQAPKFFIFENVSNFLTSICTDIDGEDCPIADAIERNLAEQYLIASNILNLKNFGANSSRTRTLVIGVRRDIKEITPLDLFPDYEEEKTLGEVISNLDRLKKMGEFSKNDIYHFFRPYKEHMIPWIEATPYGKSAFENENNEHKPHQIIDGKIVINKSKNGNKYHRQRWDKVAPCIHTRSDCLPSQNTVHPEDNRVFSIRELMLMMTIPENFRWVRKDELPSNNASHEEKSAFRKKHEINIRQCIGEAVPTNVITKIGKKIIAYTDVTRKQKLSIKEIKELIVVHELHEVDNLLRFLDQESNDFDEDTLFKICELANAEREQTGAFYTSKQICFSALQFLPDIKKETIRILEPSVGAGVFVNQISKKYPNKKIIVDCVDINNGSLRVCKELLRKTISHPDIEINYHHADFLEWSPKIKKYDLVIGNPPFMKVKDAKKLSTYRRNMHNRITNNIFSFFIEKSLRLGACVSLILPKSLLNAPEYSLTRDIIKDKMIMHINDYNEKAFDVKIETISLTLNNKVPPPDHVVSIYSYLRLEFFYQRQDYIFYALFDNVLLYRNAWFDNVADTLRFGKFKVFRDRQITKSQTKSFGKIRVIKSRNIGHNQLVNIDGYDSYINETSKFSVTKFINTNAIIVPNLTYNPRAVRLPKNCIADGSGAILYTDEEILDSEIDYFSSEEFNTFYRIARNYGTRSMNIDSNSVKYFGTKANRTDLSGVILAS